MLKRRAVLVLGVVTALGAGLLLAAVARSIGPFDEREHSSEPPATEPQNPTPIDGGKAAYEGPLGDFFVVPNEAADFPCQAREKAVDAKGSELDSAAFGRTAEVAKCADGTVVGISEYGREAMGRRYFVGAARVPYQAPLDRLQLLTVGGKPAIAQMPLPEIPQTLRLAVIERFPSEGKPGILVWIDNTDKSLSEAEALATRVMGGAP